MILPTTIQHFIGDREYQIDEIGKSSSQVLCFDTMVLKIERECEESNNEYAMLHWLQDKLPVPQILCYEQRDDVNYLLMSKLEGNMLCSGPLLKDTNTLVQLVADGLRALWRVDISNCPYDNSLDHKLKLAEMRVQSGICSMDDAQPDTYGEGGFSCPADLLAYLKHNKPIQTPVFSHGDFCLPNIFAQNGNLSGFIDLGRSGIADAYQDIALCYRSLRDNLVGPYSNDPSTKFDPNALFDCLHITPNHELIHYYILLDELF